MIRDDATGCLNTARLDGTFMALESGYCGLETQQLTAAGPVS